MISDVNKTMCCVLGDSISEGIGSKKLNYISKLENLSNGKVSYVNLAKTGTTIDFVVNDINRITSYHPQIYVVMYGSVDAQIRANIWKNKFGLCSIIPQRYKNGGMLEPRAFFSSKWYRFIPDRVDNIARKIIKKFVLLTQGTVQWVSAEEFRTKYEKLLQQLKSITPNIILVSTVYIDDVYFLGSSKEYRIFNKIIQELAVEYELEYLDLYSVMEEKVNRKGWHSIYTNDHFHPNDAGYELIAKSLWNIIERIKESGKYDCQNC